MTTWVIPTQEHLDFIADNMRDSDVKEVWLSVGLTPHDVLRILMISSDVVVCALRGDEPIYIMGGKCMSMLSHNIGHCWGLATTYCDSHRILLAKSSLRGFEILWDALGVNMLTCSILEDRKDVLKWIKWLGATLSEERTRGVNGGVFIPYTIRRR